MLCFRCIPSVFRTVPCCNIVRVLFYVLRFLCWAWPFCILRGRRSFLRSLYITLFVLCYFLRFLLYVIHIFLCSTVYAFFEYWISSSLVEIESAIRIVSMIVWFCSARWSSTCSLGCRCILLLVVVTSSACCSCTNLLQCVVPVLPPYSHLLYSATLPIYSTMLPIYSTAALPLVL